MKKILIVSNNQFGYHTDTLKYCEHLGSSYKIEFLCCDNNLPKVVINNIKVHYLSNQNKLKKRIEFLKKLKHIAINFKPDIIFIDYFIGCSFVKILLGNKYIYNLDIRSGMVTQNTIKRRIIDLIFRIEASAFSNVSIISEGLQKKLNIKNKNVHYLPLGAEILEANRNKNSSEIHNKTIKMIYVGSLTGRNIEQTILGTKYFFDKYCRDDLKISYDIIGFSNDSNDEEMVKKYINDNKLNDIVKFHGRLENKVALEFVSQSSIGISYIPITEYYNFQPPTKTFEYLLSGIPCLATKTYANAQIINKINGKLICDNAESFCEGLFEIINNYNNYSSDEIINSVKDYAWDNIITNNLEPYLISLCNEK